MKAWMPAVEHIIVPIDVFNIHVVIIVPASWPSLDESERITVVGEAVISAIKAGVPHVERVVMAKMLAVMVISNSTVMVSVVSIAVIPVVAVAVIAVVSVVSVVAVAVGCVLFGMLLPMFLMLRLRGVVLLPVL